MSWLEERAHRFILDGVSNGMKFYAKHKNLLPKSLQNFISNHPSSRPEPSGFINIRSNCYMNAIIQALASSNTIVQQFRDITRLELNRSKVFIILFDLVQGINSGRSSVRDNTLKLKLLREKIKWTKIDQQDAFELLCSLVNAIHRDLVDALPSKEIEFPFRLKVVYRHSGSNDQLRVQNQVGLSVGLCGAYDNWPGVELKYLVEQSLSPMIIDGDPTKTIQMIFYQKIPEVFILHIQANKWDSRRKEMVKPVYYIIYREQMVLDLNICRAADNEIMRKRDIIYELTAVVHHIGSALGGHYVTYRKHKGQWYLANDSAVERVEFSYNICPYILIYEKQEAPLDDESENEG